MDAEKTPELTPEERLQYYYGIRPGILGSGTPEAFDILPIEERPVFVFKMLTATEQQNFQDKFYEDGNKIPSSKMPSAIRFILDLALTGWSNYSDGKGFQIPFEREETRISEACYACIAIPMRSALFGMILSRNTLSKKETTAVK